jgi:hypothetical protein
MPLTPRKYMQMAIDAMKKSISESSLGLVVTEGNARALKYRAKM